MDKNTEIKQRMQEALQEIVSFDKEINENNIDSFIDILILDLGSLFVKNIRNELENAVSQDNKILIRHNVYLPQKPWGDGYG